MSQSQSFFTDLLNPDNPTPPELIDLFNQSQPIHLTQPHFEPAPFTSTDDLRSYSAQQLKAARTLARNRQTYHQRTDEARRLNPAAYKPLSPAQVVAASKVRAYEERRLCE